MSKTLSIMPYYGGKARMAHFIADRLNYDDSEVYIEPFGGACRVLLNKPRHKTEIYNDYGDGVCAVMQILSDPTHAKDFIYRLYETEYSQKAFNDAKEIFDYAETDFQDQYGNSIISELKAIMIHYKILPKDANMRLLKAVLKDEKAFNLLAESIKNETEDKRNAIRAKIKPLLADYNELKLERDEKGYLYRPRDMGKCISDMDLAIATYIVFMQSRDAMGQYWSPSKFKSTEQYRKQVLKLFECADRLEGVYVHQMDAMEFFRWYVGVNRDQVLDDIDENYKIMLRWIFDPQVMMYCDPSYIDPKDEAKLLDGIDWQNEDCLNDAIQAKYGDSMPSNLGKIYASSFNYRDQENFLRCIYDADCKLMVSNYDLILYNKYLTSENNWKRIEFLTTTSVGSKKDNKRLEVLWYNY
jgi:site-specific DNA-adenine methylase